MGAYAPAPCLTDDLKPQVLEVLQRTVEALAAEGRKYIGVLYGGFMLTKAQLGPGVTWAIHDHHDLDRLEMFRDVESVCWLSG